MSAFAAVMAFALMTSAPKPTIVILPARMEHEDPKVLDPKWVEPTAPSAIDAALRKEAARKFVVLPCEDVKRAAIDTGLGRLDSYTDPAKIESLRANLHADVVIAPVVRTYDWFTRTIVHEKVLTPRQIRRQVRREGDSRSIFDPIPVTRKIIEQRPYHAASLYAYLTTPTSTRKTKLLTVEKDADGPTAKTEDATSAGVAKLVMSQYDELSKPSGRRPPAPPTPTAASTPDPGGVPQP